MEASDQKYDQEEGALENATSGVVEQVIETAPTSTQLIIRPDRTVAVIGKTLPFQDMLRNLGGTQDVQSETAWTFPSGHREAVEEFLVSTNEVFETIVHDPSVVEDAEIIQIATESIPPVSAEPVVEAVQQIVEQIASQPIAGQSAPAEVMVSDTVDTSGAGMSEMLGSPPLLNQSSGVFVAAPAPMVSPVPITVAPISTSLSYTEGEPRIVDASPRLMALVGNAAPWEDQLRNIGGKFKKHLKLGDTKIPAWTFPKSKLETVKHFIPNVPVIPAPESAENVLFSPKKRKRDISTPSTAERRGTVGVA